MLNNLLLGQTAEEKNFIEDLFSCYLYTGNGSTQTITNGIDLAGNGGLVWIKSRTDAVGHQLYDTNRGAGYVLFSNGTGSSTSRSDGITSFGSSGFSLGANSQSNSNGSSFVSWAFRKAQKFFDVVTWSGNSTNRTISHSLGSVPGLILVKATDSAFATNWQVYHRSLANTEYMVLNTTAAKATGTTRWNSTTPTATEFSLGDDASVNESGTSYIAYLFANDTTTDGVIQCGSISATTSTDVSVSLGWEPQFILIKPANTTGNWSIIDSMRGFTWSTGSDGVTLKANSSDAENTTNNNSFLPRPTPTGFILGQSFGLSTGDSLIYLAIRRGPMRTPTDATKVFAPVARTGTSATATITTNFATDLTVIKIRNTAAPAWQDRLRGTGEWLRSDSTTLGQATGDQFVTAYNNTGFVVGPDGTGYVNYSGTPYINWSFRRAPGFFDVVCYTGTGSTSTVSHNLGVAPELMIVKRRDTTADWQVYPSAAGEYLVVNTTAAKVTSNTDRWNNTAPTSTVFSLGTNAVVNASGGTYVAYLFATCVGVSKVGTYTGSGTTKQIDCGFTNGARFVLIKRTDSTGDWYVWDTERGVVTGNDPYLLLNSASAEVTNTDYIDPYSSGFELSSTAPAALNANGGTFLYLAIA